MSVAFVLIGPPGGGKSTLVRFLAGLGFESISSREALLKKEGNDPEFARRHPVAQTMKAGGLCCNEALRIALGAELTEVQGSLLVLDGAVRTAGQVEPVVRALRTRVEMIGFIQFICSSETCGTRMIGRRKLQHEIREDDDSLKKIHQRLNLYEANLPGILHQLSVQGFEPFVINAELPPESVLQQSALILAAHVPVVARVAILHC